MTFIHILATVDYGWQTKLTDERDVDLVRGLLLKRDEPSAAQPIA